MDLQQTALGEEDDEGSQNRGVRFPSIGKMEQVKRISRYSNYEIDEIIAYWGDSEEHRLRKEELREAAMDWKMGRRTSDNFTFTSAGIADKVGEGRALKRENRIKARNAVLDEQDLQYEEGVKNEELLAEIYTLTTVDAKKKARAEAEHMAEEVGKLNT